MPAHDSSSSSSLPAIGPISPIASLRSCSTFQFDYLLHEGKIYIRTRTPDAPKTMSRGDLINLDDSPENCDWLLFDGVGIPFDNDMKPLLGDGEELVELAVASEILVAVSNKNQVYLYKPTANERPLSWESHLGAPDFIAGKLYLPDQRRDWAFSCSVIDKPEVRKTDFIHPNEKVGFSSDANGINFDFGFTPTIYVLGKDGQKVSYWDTGLPPSFSRGFLLPDGMQGQTISAAGSTVFLSAIDSDGELHFFSRNIDYEINGACPGLAISYDDNTPKIPPPNDEPSYYLGHGIRKLPLPGWVEHPVDDISKFLNHNVCIRLNGEGDEARELRIQGIHPLSGDRGYYSKGITEDEWKFTEDPAVEHSEKIRKPFDPSLPYSLKMNYEGQTYARPCLHFKRRATETNIFLEIRGFHPYMTDSDPLYLIIKDDQGNAESIRIYAVDAWGMHYHTKHDEDLIGSVDGEPKALVGTLMLTGDQLAQAKNNATPIATYINQYLLKYHGKTKALPIIADNGMLIFKLNHKEFRFSRELSKQEVDNSFYMRKAMDPQLLPSKDEANDLEQLIFNNKACRDELKKVFMHRQVIDSSDITISAGSSALRPAASLFFSLESPEDPTYEQALHDIDILFKAHRRALVYSVKGKTKPQGYDLAIAVLTDRITGLQEQLEDDVYHAPIFRAYRY